MATHSIGKKPKSQADVDCGLLKAATGWGESRGEETKGNCGVVVESVIC